MILPLMLERVRRCHFCQREMNVPALSYEQNPFCSKCLPERMEEVQKQAALVSWIVSGEYLEPIDLSRQKRQ